MGPGDTLGAGEGGGGGGEGGAVQGEDGGVSGQPGDSLAGGVGFTHSPRQVAILWGANVQGDGGDGVGVQAGGEDIRELGHGEGWQDKEVDGDSATHTGGG